MNRKDYINTLKFNLQGLPIDEVQDILSDYEEHFEIGISKGKAEEEITSELGDPKEVAQGYRSNYRPIAPDSKPVSNTNNNKKFIFGLLLVFVNIIILFGPAMGLFGILVGFFGMGIGFVFGGIGMILRLPFGFLVGNGYPHILTSLGLGFGLGTLGILVLILAVFLVKLLYKLITKYIKWNIELINK